jgi:hypothetical protein
MALISMIIKLREVKMITKPFKSLGFTHHFVKDKRLWAFRWKKRVTPFSDFHSEVWQLGPFKVERWWIKDNYGI